ncbi:terminase large subunit domain-containing protein [Qipengyuania flava]|uniref:terminase large subunit domain-containing protein n=1 Tax=Qipengyuania flava TaxID=192812 RepID=UPI00273F24C1|nr:terminase family protein [Qipengyuania flava]
MHLLPAHDGKTELTAAFLKRQARSLYWRGWPLVDIQEELGIEKYQTLASWKNRGKWDDASPRQVIEDRIEAKIASYLDRPDFNEGHMKRVDFLTRQMERMARIGKFESSGKEGDLNPRIAARNDDAAKAKRADKRKNFLTLDQWQALLDDFHDRNFTYQAAWWEQRDQRTRKILKSRQIGATWYFAREALAKIADDVLAGQQPRNQIFLSASRRQANKFRREIVSWVKRVTGVDLAGDPIMLDFGGLETEDGEPIGGGLDQVGLYPMSTNSNTSQGESGDFYFDEFFWAQGFAELRKVAAAMATHKIFKRTYFSTPSTKTHDAFAFWSGEEWNKGKAKADQREFDCSHSNLAKGKIMPDGSWCQVVTLQDAIAGGLADLVDIEELRTEASDDEFRNLYECEFVDDSESSFPWALLAPARVDSFYAWRDFEPAKLDIPGARPFGDKPVWLGYDPNHQGRDDAALTVIAPPELPGVGKFRILAKFRLNGLDFQEQADFIRSIARRFNVTDIAIDASGGIGAAVLQLVQRWFPNVRAIEYTIAVKAALVLKGQRLFRDGRVEFDQAWKDLMAAFMAIRPTLTGSGKSVTYTASRAGGVGHADLAWSVLHAFSNEPLDAAGAAEGTGRVRFAVSD